MNAIEATVQLISTWTVTGKLADLNVGETFDLTRDVFDMFSAQKPAKQPKTPVRAVETPKTPTKEPTWD